MIVIRQLFNKSEFLIIFFISVSLISCLGFSTILNSYYSNILIPDFISQNAIVIDIKDTSNLDNNAKLLPLDTLQPFLNSINSNFIIYKEHPLIKAKGIYFKNFSQFNPNITYGRNFTDNDFIMNNNSLIINENSNKILSIINNNQFSIENSFFDVIGTFTNQKDNLINNSDIYFNMMNTDFSSNSILEGRYILDAGKQTALFKEELITFLKSISNSILIDTFNIDKLQDNSLKKALSSEYFSVLVIVLTIFLLIINIFIATYNWISSKKTELFVRVLCGSSKSKLIKTILYQYILILIVSFLIGVILSILIIYLNIFPSLGYSIHLVGSILSLIFCLLLGITIGSIYLNLLLKNSPLYIQR